MELGRDNSVLEEDLERHDGEGGLVGGFEDNGTACSCLLDLEPACGTDTPAIAWLEAGEAVLWHRGGKIVAEGFGHLKEGGIDDAADGVDAEVVGTGLAAAGAVEAGHGLASADLERLTEDVFAARFNGFGSSHRYPLECQYPTFVKRVREVWL